MSPSVTAVEVRVSSQWLRLREPADAAARSTDLATKALGLLGRATPVVVHAMKARDKFKPAEAESAPTEDITLLTEIRDLLKDRNTRV